MSSTADPSMPATYDSAAREGRFVADLRDVVRYRYLVFQLIKRNVTSRYKRSVLGIGWTLLDPLLTMAVMTAVYSALFRRSIEAFPVFIMTGLLTWFFFSQSATQGMRTFLHGRSLLGRVYMPKSVMAIAAVGTGLVNFVISIGLLVVLMIIFDRPFTWALLFIPVALVLLTLFTLGVSLLVSSWAVFFGDVENIFGFTLRLGLYLSGIFYTLDILPEKLQIVVLSVPTYHMITLFREPIYAGALPSWSTFLVCLAWALGAFVVGFWVFTKNSNAYAYRI